jgi:hypothetical protein
MYIGFPAIHVISPSSPARRQSNFIPKRAIINLVISECIFGVIFSFVELFYTLINGHFFSLSVIPDIFAGDTPFDIAINT